MAYVVGRVLSQLEREFIFTERLSGGESIRVKFAGTDHQPLTFLICILLPSSMLALQAAQTAEITRAIKARRLA